MLVPRPDIKIGSWNFPGRPCRTSQHAPPCLSFPQGNTKGFREQNVNPSYKKKIYDFLK